MIASIRGTVTAVGSASVVVETNGIGYQVLVPHTVLHALGAPGAEVLLYTHLHVREDALALYGFASPEERAFFETLIGVTGVGPRMALGLLSAVPFDQLQHAIVSEDVALLAKVPGIGRKTAARLVLELKGKLSQVALAAPHAVSLPTAMNAELQDVLTSLGYSALEAQAAVAAIPADAPPDLEERLRLALQYFGGV